MIKSTIPDYSQILKSIRELALDLNPVSAITCQKQGFVLTVDATSITLESEGGEEIGRASCRERV